MGKIKYTKELLEQCIADGCNSFSDICRYLGLSTRGSNYLTIR